MIVSTQAINEAIKKSLNNLTIITDLGGISKDFERKRAFDALTELKTLLDQVATFNPDDIKDVEEYNHRWRAKQAKAARDAHEAADQLELFKKEESNVVRKKGKK